MPREQEQFISGSSAQWAVHWIVVKKGRKKVIDYDCGTNLDEAIRVYGLAKKAEKPFATLRCKNVGFPPPEKYQVHEKLKKRWVTKGGRKKIDRYYVTVDPMLTVNERGIWWCPYCRELRKFLKQSGFNLETIYIPEGGKYCPICGTSHRDYWVRKYNPAARAMAYEGPRIRRKKNGRGKRSR
jgi:hypothetical protein